MECMKGMGWTECKEGRERSGCTEGSEGEVVHKKRVSVHDVADVDLHPAYFAIRRFDFTSVTSYPLTLVNKRSIHAPRLNERSQSKLVATFIFGDHLKSKCFLDGELKVLRLYNNK